MGLLYISVDSAVVVVVAVLVAVAAAVAAVGKKLETRSRSSFEGSRGRVNPGVQR